MKVLLTFVVLMFWTVTGWADPPALIPLPQQMELQAGTFTLCPAQFIPGAPAPASTRILADAASRETGEFLAAQLFKSTGYRFEVAADDGIAAAPGAILLTTNGAASNLGAEGYDLTVATNSVVIRAPASAGVFYGVQTLLQLLPPEIYSPRPVAGVPWTAPCAHIVDQPRFPWRGWMLDSVRHFFTVDEVKGFLDSMAVHKLNMFHWHLDDDAGWRIEIQSWPLLTQVGAWRTNILFGLNPKSSLAWNTNGLYGGYYKQSEIREIVAYAAQRHITIVPEIEMPGHSAAALFAYPQFGCNCPTCSVPPTSIDVTNTVNGRGVLCVARPETMSFLHDVLSEVMALFPGPYIHIGGDEVSFYNWQRHDLDLNLKNSLGISGTGTAAMQQYQSYFTQQIANWVKSQGKTMIGWSEIENGGLVTNAVVMDWLTGSSSRGVQAATNQQYAVMTPTTACYINFVENPGVTWSNEPPSQSGTVTLSTAYNYEPIPATLPSAYTNYILGAQGNNWAEFIPSQLNMEFKMFPRLSALAEVNWTQPGLKNYADFLNRLATHKQRLDAMGVNYNPSAEPPQVAAWVAGQMLQSPNFTVLTWDVTSSVTEAGEMDLSFCWKTGNHGLEVQWAALLENGVEIDRDTHDGFTGVTPSRPAYVLRLPARRPGATYTLQASVAGRGGNISNGVIYRTNWD